MEIVFNSATKQLVPVTAEHDAKATLVANQAIENELSQLFISEAAQKQLAKTTTEQQQAHLPLLTPPTVEKDAAAVIECLAKLLPAVMNLLGVSDVQLLALLNKISETLRELNAKIRISEDKLKITTLQSSEKVKNSKYAEAGSLLTSAISGSTLSMGMTIAGAGISFKRLQQTTLSTISAAHKIPL